MENEYKPLSKIAGENLKRLIKETKYRTQEELLMPLELKRGRSADGLIKALKILTH